MSKIFRLDEKFVMCGKVFYLNKIIHVWVGNYTLSKDMLHK